MIFFFFETQDRLGFSPKRQAQSNPLPKCPHVDGLGTRLTETLPKRHKSKKNGGCTIRNGTLMSFFGFVSQYNFRAWYTTPTFPLRRSITTLTMTNDDFTAWEVLGTLPSLANLTLNAADCTQADSNRHHAHAAKNSNSQTRSHSGGPNYFDALERLSVTGPFLFIQHLLGFIDSPCLGRLL